MSRQKSMTPPGFDKSAVSGSGQACIRIYGKRCMLWKGGLQERVS